MAAFYPAAVGFDRAAAIWQRMDAAAPWMADHGIPPPIRGVRNTGEQAMLVRPEDACGAYIGFVGPAS